MKHVLSRHHRCVVEQFAWSNVLIGFDFDGTLAPIVRDPPAAKMRATTRALLATVASSYPCAVISGRARDDVRTRLEGIALVDVIGNHGLESLALGTADTSRSSRRYRTLVSTWNRALSARLAEHQGVEIENKVFSIAIHYRKSRKRREARARIEDAVCALGPDVRSVDGKLAVNITPEGAPHKGAALSSLRVRFGADTAIYVGDDATDEDVFSLDEPGRLLSIRVGRTVRSAAPYFLRDQREIDPFLRLLVSRRSPRMAMRRSA